MPHGVKSQEKPPQPYDPKQPQEPPKEPPEEPKKEEEERSAARWSSTGILPCGCVAY
jgi:hypothetical protein